jgi:hypothetical protein
MRPPQICLGARERDSPRQLGACRDELQEIVHHVPALHDLKARLGHMTLSLPVEARAICPGNPGLPQARCEPPQRPGGARIFEQPNQAARLDDATKLLERRHLQIIR